MSSFTQPNSPQSSNAKVAETRSNSNEFLLPRRGEMTTTSTASQDEGIPWFIPEVVQYAMRSQRKGIRNS